MARWRQHVIHSGPLGRSLVHGRASMSGLLLSDLNPLAITISSPKVATCFTNQRVGDFKLEYGSHSHGSINLHVPTKGCSQYFRHLTLFPMREMAIKADLGRTSTVTNLVILNDYHQQHTFQILRKRVNRTHYVIKLTGVKIHYNMHVPHTWQHFWTNKWTIFSVVPLSRRISELIPEAFGNTWNYDFYIRMDQNQTFGRGWQHSGGVVVGVWNGFKSCFMLFFSFRLLKFS